MIELLPMKPKYLEQVLALSIADEQIIYAGTAEEILLNADAIVHPHLVMHDRKVVGIFLIDTRYSHGYDFASTDSLGFRAFIIDISRQGQGYGRATIEKLRDYLVDQYPSFSTVYLTVNCKNRSAYHCYQNNGFIDSNELYLKGAAGPQHIMSMDLKS